MFQLAYPCQSALYPVTKHYSHCDITELYVMSMQPSDGLTNKKEGLVVVQLSLSPK